MRHLDLFSGIGGFALATEMVWPETEHTFCDKEPFAQAILKKHWPNSKIYDDIKTLRTPPTADLITGGFPCQPFSFAGKRKGSADDRHLWPEMLRCIRDAQPRWVIAKNVNGIISMVLDEVLSDLEALGYTSRAFVIPACAVGAPHRRDRVWIVAHTDNKRQQRTSTQSSTKGTRGTKIVRDNSWDRPVVEAAAGLCRVVHGVPKRMDKQKRIKALGNAIVPQVAVEIMRMIKAVDPSMS